MPPINQAVVTASIAAVSLAVAAAVAVYESDEVRRVADDIRRRIAIALQSIGNEFNHGIGNGREPLFNRPEDAEGFLLSRSATGGDPGVDADDASRKRQREELLYWNAIRESKLMADERAARDAAIDAATHYGRSLSSGPTVAQNFDELLKQEKGGTAGTIASSSGAYAGDRQGLIRRRGLATIVYAHPFADENHVGLEELEEVVRTPPPPSTASTDMYNATPLLPMAATVPNMANPPEPPLPREARLSPDTTTATANNPAPVSDDATAPSRSSASMPASAESSEVADDEYATAGQDRSAYASIQAWAQDNQPDFYSPLPMSPEESASDAELLSAGQLTPTDSVSVVDVANELERASDAEGRDLDVLSESEGIPTPASWSEIGSVISDSEPPHIA